MFTRMFLCLLVVSLIAIGCSSEQPLAPSVDQTDTNITLDDSTLDTGDAAMKPGFGGYGHSGDPVTFLVRIENVSDGMTLHLSNGETAPAPHSPGVWTVTRLFNPLFKVGRRDLGQGLEQQAEDGNPTMLAASMEANHFVKSSGVFAVPVGDDMPGPGPSGQGI
ncbi:MAG: hypothetical protein R3F48_00335 [Candidatus Zixiibacteriota bacterium]